MDDERWRQFEGKRDRVAAEKVRLGSTRVQPDSDVAQAFAAASEQHIKAVRLPPPPGTSQKRRQQSRRSATAWSGTR